MDFGVDWTDLPTDLLGFIASFLTIIEDFMAFRGVCKGWRSAATKDTFVSVSKLPLLLLAEDDNSDMREYYSLSKRKICMRSPLYEVKGKRIMDVGFGWILALTLSGEVCLLKPFSSARFELPKYTEYPKYSYVNPRFHFISRACLTANPSKTSDFKLVVAAKSNLGVWKNGDNKWTSTTPIGTSGLHMVYRNGKLFSMYMGHEPGPCTSIRTWDLNDLSKPEKIVGVANGPIWMDEELQHYLVESTDGELLFITRNNAYADDYIKFGANHFEVERVDLEKGELVEIDGLGKDAIFVGDNVSVAVDATEFPGVLRPNCIYFTDDCIFPHGLWMTGMPRMAGMIKGCGKDMGIYNVEDESIERFQVESFGRVCSPIWIFPSF